MKRKYNKFAHIYTYIHIKIRTLTYICTYTNRICISIVCSFEKKYIYRYMCIYCAVNAEQCICKPANLDLYKIKSGRGGLGGGLKRGNNVLCKDQLLRLPRALASSFLLSVKLVQVLYTISWALRVAFTHVLNTHAMYLIGIHFKLKTQAQIQKQWVEHYALSWLRVSVSFS